MTPSLYFILSYRSLHAMHVREIGLELHGSLGDPLLNIGTTEENFQISRISTVCKDKLKLIDSFKATEPAEALRNVAGRPSGPPLLIAFNL
jgi:hypothetical protein